MLWRMMLREFCKTFHGQRHLRPSIVGGGMLRCSACGAGFEDLVDAGVMEPMFLDWDALQRAQATLRAQEARAAELRGAILFGAGEWKVKQGGVVRIGRYALNGEPVELGTPEKATA